MFIWNWFYSVLNSLGLYNKNAKILFLGLDNAELQMAGINFKAFDLGGHEIARKVWKDYYAKVDAIVYLVDSADRDRFPESRIELDSLLSDDSLADGAVF
eukprot:jgi/Picre1/27291/NNA_000260.t1